MADPFTLRSARADDPSARDRDLADRLGVSEAQLLAAQTGDGPARVVRIDADPGRLIPAIQGLGEVMALTRNDDCVSEVVGRYEAWHPGDHAAMVLGDEIDLRIFPRHWVHAFAVERPGEAGSRRSLQVFDAAGDAVHKVHLRDTSVPAGWEAAISTLRGADQSDRLEVERRAPVEAAKADPAKRDVLRQEWARLTDTHQFLRLCAKLRMNRLGAYRIAGDDLARPLGAPAVDAMLTAVRDAGVEVMLFVGNRG